MKSVYTQSNKSLKSWQAWISAPLRTQNLVMSESPINVPEGTKQWSTRSSSFQTQNCFSNTAWKSHSSAKGIQHPPAGHPQTAFVWEPRQSRDTNEEERQWPSVTWEEVAPSEGPRKGWRALPPGKVPKKPGNTAKSKKEKHTECISINQHRKHAQLSEKELFRLWNF